MAILTVRVSQQPTSILHAPQRRRQRQIDSSAALDQRAHRLEFAAQCRRTHSAVGIRSVLAQQIDQRKLRTTLAHYASSRDEHKRFVLRRLARARIENNLRHINNVRRQLAMANRILGDEFQQRWFAEVVPSLENQLLLRQLRMPLQVRAQASYVTCIEEFHGAAECCIFNPLLVRQFQSIGERWFFDVPFQSRPARESTFASDGKLRVAQAELGVEDFSVRGLEKTRMKFPDPLRYSRAAAFAFS